MSLEYSPISIRESNVTGKVDLSPLSPFFHRNQFVIAQPLNTNNVNNALREAYRVLKPGGRFICLEFSKINNYNLRKLYNLYSKNIPKIGNIIVGDDKPYEYLVESIKNFYSQEQLVNLMKKNNFYKVKYRNINCGIVAIHSGWKI